MRGYAKKGCSHLKISTTTLTHRGYILIYLTPQMGGFFQLTPFTVVFKVYGFFFLTNLQSRAKSIYEMVTEINLFTDAAVVSLFFF